ncbi:MAG TPA: hypothetical protein VFQ35_26085 [Polyangiaceae bacterium]|nr:hypothetical protein [Polyangiaceae bacterium]
MPLRRHLTSALVASIVACVAGCGGSQDHGASLIAPDSMGGNAALGGRSSGKGGSTAAGDASGGAADSSGGALNAGASNGGAPSAGAANGGAPNAGSANAEGGAVNANGGTAGGGGEVALSLCNPGANWTLMTRIPSASTPSFARFGGISADELTIAWTAANGDAFVATRTAMTAEFGAPSKVNSSPLAVGRVALSPTGAYLIGVSADQKNLVAFALKGDAWSMTDGPEFGMLRMSSEGDSTLSDPVLGSDKRSLYFLRTVGGVSSIYASTWDPSARIWGAPSSLGNPELTASAGHAMRPTGASRDGRTLFFFDEASRTERAAFRPDAEAAFDVFTTLGGFVGATANLGCTTLYYEDRDDSGVGVFVAR